MRQRSLREEVPKLLEFKSEIARIPCFDLYSTLFVLPAVLSYQEKGISETKCKGWEKVVVACNDVAIENKRFRGNPVYGLKFD